MYREQARYLERIYKWCQARRHCRNQKADHGQPDKRRAYFDRFVESQKYAQVDPWSERVSGKDKHEFNPNGDAHTGGGGMNAMTRNWVAIGEIADIPLRGAALREKRRNHQLPFSAPPDNRVFAIEDKCPHKMVR